MNFKKTISLLTLIALVFILISTACNVKNKTTLRAKRAEHSKGNITIGVAGPWAKMKEGHEDLAQGIQLAVHEINTSGGILGGRKINIIWKDDKGTAKEGKLVAIEFCNNPDVIAVIGHVNSSVALAASVLYNYNGILMLSPTATTPQLTTREGYNLIFRNINTDVEIAEVLIKYAANTGFKSRAFIKDIIIYNEDDIYGNVLAKEFEKQANIFRIETVARRTYGIDSGETFFKDDLKHVTKVYGFDAIFIAGLSKHAAMIINEARKLGGNIEIFCGEGVDGTELIKFAGLAANDVVYCSTYNPDRKSKRLLKFKTNFKNFFGYLPGEKAVQGYDAVYVLAKAIEAAGTTVPAKVAKALHNIKYKGIAGTISFNKNGNLVEKNIVLKKIENGKEKVISN